MRFLGLVATFIAFGCTADAASGSSSKVSIEPVVKKLQDFAAPRSARIRAATSLGQSKNPQAIAPLLDILSRSSDKLYDAVEEALRTLDAPTVIAKDLDSPSAEIRARAALQLLLLEDGKLTPKLKALARQDPSAEVRAELVTTLAKWDIDDEVPFMLQTLEADADPQVRSAAVQALSDHVSEDGVRARLQLAMGREKDPATKFFLKKALASKSSAG